MKGFNGVLASLPERVSEEIWRIAGSRGKNGSDISEMRLRAFGRCSVRIGYERILLSARCTRDEIGEVFLHICEGSVYAKREELSEGYVTLGGGIRVGVCGTARYDGGALVGISDISSLVFRIPTSEFFDTYSLYSAFKSSRSGMLIYSPPGGGKTTALRSLAALIGRCGEEVAVIDERCEFLFEDYAGCSVDILRGHKRALGVEIALRTLSPTVMIIDEIGRAEECEALLGLLNSGVRLIATAHAENREQLFRRDSVFSLMKKQIFDTCVGIRLKNGQRSLVFERLDE